MESTQADLRVGLVLNGRYRITQQLGEGGMGLVYRGERIQLGKPVAIKFLHSPYAHSARFVARFQREARAMSKLSHPYCVSVLDFGVHDQAPYIVMDFVTGCTLREVMDDGRLAPRRAIDITRQLLAGLAHAHGQGVIHRDIKPGNIMLGEATGLGDHVRIFDFGLAKLHDPELDGEPSMAAIVGTPAYMAPEQTRAEKVDERADLYAAGVVLFEMFTGRKPFPGSEAYEILMMQRDQAPPLLRSLSPELSPELEAVVSKALEKEPAARFQSASEFVLTLETTPEWRNGGSERSQPFEVQRDSRLMARAPEGAARPQERVSPVPRVSEPSREQPQRSLAKSSASMQAALESDSEHTEPEPEPPVTKRRPGLARAAAASGRTGSAGGFPFLRIGVGAVALSAALLWWRSQPEDSAAASAVRSLPKAAAALLDKVPKPSLPTLEPSSPIAAEPTAEPSEQPAEAAGEPEPAKGEDADDQVDMDLSEAALAAADEALNDTEEREVKLPSQAEAGSAKVSSIADVKALIAKDKVEAAIAGIQQLRRETPHAPQLPFMLGNLYVDKGWVSDGLAKYRETIKLAAGYRKNARIQRDAIKALGMDRIYPRARALLVRDVGRAALPALRRAAASDPSRDVRKRAASVLKQITR